MSLHTSPKTGLSIHYPRDPERFAFDDEVAAHFDEMAQRSIPAYNETHAMQAAIVDRHRRNVRHKEPYTVIDYGASVGRAFLQLCNRFQTLPAMPPNNLRAYAIDHSIEMLRRIEQSMPWVECVELDLCNTNALRRLSLPKADVIYMNYILQFIPISFKKTVMRHAFMSLRSGGILFISHKESNGVRRNGVVADAIDEAYIEFRQANGYSQDEIDAKTKALESIMSCSTRQGITEMLYGAGFGTLYDLTRWGPFASMCAFKKGA